MPARQIWWSSATTTRTSPDATVLTGPRPSRRCASDRWTRSPAAHRVRRRRIDEVIPFLGGGGGSNRRLRHCTTTIVPDGLRRSTPDPHAVGPGCLAVDHRLGRRADQGGGGRSRSRWGVDDHRAERRSRGCALDAGDLVGRRPISSPSAALPMWTTGRAGSTGQPGADGASGVDGGEAARSGGCRGGRPAAPGPCSRARATRSVSSERRWITASVCSTPSWRVAATSSRAQAAAAWAVVRSRSATHPPPTRRGEQDEGCRA